MNTIKLILMILGGLLLFRWARRYFAARTTAGSLGTETAGTGSVELAPGSGPPQYSQDGGGNYDPESLGYAPMGSAWNRGGAAATYGSPLLPEAQPYPHRTYVRVYRGERVDMTGRIGAWHLVPP